MTCWGQACTGGYVTPLYCLPGKAFAWEAVWGFKKPHIVNSKEKVWEQTSALLQWVVFSPGFRTTAPKRSSSMPSLYPKGLFLHWRKLWRHGHTAHPSLQISDVVDQARVTLCLHILLWDRAQEVHLRGEHSCRSSAAETISSQVATRAGAEIYRNVRSGWKRPKQQLVLKHHLCRGK